MASVFPVGPAPDDPEDNTDDAYQAALEEWESLKGILEPAGDLPPTPDALYGRRATGEPYKRSMAFRANKRKFGPSGKPATGGSPPKKPVKEPAKAAEFDVQWATEGLNDNLLFCAGALAVLGQQRGDIALVADGVAIANSADKLAAGIAQLGTQHEAVARVVTLLLQTGPYTALLTATATLGAQMAVNHKMLPADGIAARLGAVRPELLIAMQSERGEDATQN